MTTATLTDAVIRLRARRRAVLDALKAWPPDALGSDAWRTKMNDLRDVNRTLDRVLEQLED